jgi:hypothetical protein
MLQNGLMQHGVDRRVFVTGRAGDCGETTEIGFQ